MPSAKKAKKSAGSSQLATVNAAVDTILSSPQKANDIVDLLEMATDSDTSSTVRVAVFQG